MDGLRGVAQQHGTLAHQRLGQHLDQRVGAARAAFQQPPGAPADRVLQALQPRRIVQCLDRRGLVTGHPVHGAEVAVAARQQRGGTGVGEALIGRPVRRTRATHPRHEQGLLEVVLVHADAQRLAHATAGAVGAHHQPREQAALAAVVGDEHLAVPVDGSAQPHEARRAVTGKVRQPLQAGFQRAAEITRHHHLAEPRPLVLRGVHLHPAEIAGAADMDAGDRAGRGAQTLHHAQRGEGVDRGGSEAEVALVEHRRQGSGRGGFHQPNVAPGAVQRNGQTGTDQPAAHDHYVMSFTHAAMISAGPFPARAAACRSRR